MEGSLATKDDIILHPASCIGSSNGIISSIDVYGAACIRCIIGSRRARTRALFYKNIKYRNLG